MYEITWADIVRKLTSRKFWLAVAAFVTGILKFNGSADDTVTQVASLIMAGAAVVAYIIGEGLADSSPTYEDYWYGFDGGLDELIEVDEENGE